MWQQCSPLAVELVMRDPKGNQIKALIRSGIPHGDILVIAAVILVKPDYHIDMSAAVLHPHLVAVAILTLASRIHIPNFQ